MAFKLSKTNIAELGGFSAEIGEVWKELEDVTNDANERIKAILNEVIEKRREYEGKVEDAKNYADGIMSDIGNEFEDKSERWHESEKGQCVDGWIEELNSRFSEAELELVQIDDDLENFEIEVPNEVSHVFDVEDIPTEPTY